MNYFLALRISEYKSTDIRKKLFMALTVILNLGILFIYKYMNFVTGILHGFFPETEVTKYVLPIGISFFTFQAMSYVIDVYRGVPAQKNIAYIGLYISLFPQLIAGPIVRYTTVAEEIVSRTVTKEMFAKGMMRFVRGFNKKVLLSNMLAVLADAAFEAKELTVLLAWLGAICYTLQIFFDFSGYSEMAIGIGLMLGFHFLENFDYPYISKTITEFWRRWHMSLGTWFRDYLYFPLGGSRVKSKFRLIFNLAVVWFATGVWHGASWNFILWGSLYGVIIIFEKIMKLPALVEQKKLLRVIYQIFTMLMVVLGWVLFRAVDLPSAFNYIKAMFGIGAVGFANDYAILQLLEYLVIIIVGIIASTPLVKFVKEKCEKHSETAALTADVASYAVQLVLFIVSISFIVMNSHNPFIYFNF
jgi:alginate O-acetyltransferase complex protein AlgI